MAHEPGTISRLVRISGRVQGVGFRAWVEDEAVARGLSGWVRNRRDGTVEALFVGEAGAVEAMIAACWQGPRLAVVTAVEVDSKAAGIADTVGFVQRPTE
ncbi:MAG: acylphosphatase [Alphaproteobacteria bacterium]